MNKNQLDRKNHVFRFFVILMVAALVMAFANTGSVLAEDEPNSGKWDHTFYAYKFASQKALGPSEELTYTILLYNSSLDPIMVDVVDTIPAELSDPMNVSHMGDYDPVLRTLTWEDIEVPVGHQVLLTFDVAAAVVPTEAIDVVNTATVTTDKNTFDIEFTIKLLPELPEDDVFFPVVNSVVIDEMDVLEELEVILHIDAMDYAAPSTPGVVDQMMIKEWQVGGGTGEGWVVKNTTGWVPFESEFAYTLGDQPGVKFIGVWVMDEAGNISHATQDAFDFASYLKPDTTLMDQIGIIPYGVYYEEGVSINASLVVDEVLSDEDSSAFLLVWTPADYNNPVPADQAFAGESVGGIYVFGVSYTAASTLVYDLDISPGGGPSAWGMAPGVGMLLSSDNIENDSYNIFSVIGFDPIALALQNQPASQPTGLLVYLPILKK